jgi:hypothetical protein
MLIAFTLQGLIDLVKQWNLIPIGREDLHLEEFFTNRTLKFCNISWLKNKRFAIPLLLRHAFIVPVSRSEENFLNPEH